MAFASATGGTTPVIWPTGSTANGLSAAGFIPEIWSGKMVEKFYDATVLAAISNTDYEGEIKNQGDKVKIRTKPTITISDYLPDGALTLERPVGSVIDLLIDKAKYFNTILDDIMEIQSDLNNLSMWSDDASEQMKIKIDTAVLLALRAQAKVTTNRGIAAGRISADVNLGVTTAPLVVVARSAGVGEVEIVDVILRMGQVLDEQNIPENGRWLIIPAWAATMIKSSELRQAFLSGDGVTMLRNGKLGMIDRFTIYVSNLLPSGVAGGIAAGEYIFYAGHSHGLTFASQMTKMETMKSEFTFGTILRGLQVYGSKLVDTTAICEAVVAKA